MLIVSPTDSGYDQLGHLRLISEDTRPMPLIGKLWRAARAIADGAANHTRSNPQRRVANAWDTLKLAGALTGDSANDSRIGREAATSATNVGLNEKWRDGMGPRAKILKLSEDAAPVREIQHVANWGSRVYSLRNADLSLQSASSGIRRWGHFCGATQRSRSPPPPKKGCA